MLLGALVVGVLLGVTAGVVLWPKAENMARAATHARTANEKAANGPLPGNVPP